MSLQTYILRFDKPLEQKVSSQYGDRYHYFGKSSDVKTRLAAHRAGCGSEVTKKAVRAKIKIELQCFFDGDLEKKFQKLKFQEVCTCNLCKRIQAWGFGSGGDYVI